MQYLLICGYVLAYLCVGAVYTALMDRWLSDEPAEPATALMVVFWPFVLGVMVFGLIPMIIYDLMNGKKGV